MNTTKAQMSTMQKLIIVLLVVVLMISLGGKLYAQARNQLKTEFDPEQFYNNDVGDDLLASSLRDKLTRQQVADIGTMQLNMFANPHFKNNEPAGKLVLITSITDDNEFFDASQGKPIGLKFQTAPGGIVVYLTQEQGQAETKSLLSDYNKASYLKFKKLCYLPKEVHAPLLAEITELPTKDSYPKGVQTSTLADNYSLFEMSFTQLPQGTTNSTTFSFQGTYTQNALPTPKSVSDWLYVPTGRRFNEGLLVWIYDNTLCIMVRDQYGAPLVGGLTIGYDNNNNPSSIQGRNDFISDSMLTELKRLNKVEIV